MSEIRHEIPSEGFTDLYVELSRGNLSLSPAPEGAGGSAAADAPFEVDFSGTTVYVRCPGGATGLRLALPSSIRACRLATGRGEIELEGVAADVYGQTGKGNLRLAGGTGRAELGTAHGEVRVGDWAGPLHLHSGRGDVEVGSVGGEVHLMTGHGDVEVGSAGGEAHLSTGHGDVGIGEALRGATVRTGRGDVVAGRLGGQVRVETGYGDVVATDLAGADLSVETGHGDIALGGRLQGARVNTGRGDVDCRCAFGAGEHELATQSGNITLSLPTDAAARIDAVTRHGEVETDLPLVKVGRPGPESHFGRRFVGALGSADPAATISLRTGRGDIRIRWLGESGAVSAEAEAESATQRAWRETLEAFAGRRGQEEDIERRLEEVVEGVASEVGRQVEDVVERVVESVAGPGDRVSQEVEPSRAAASREEAGTGAAGRDEEMAVLEAVSRGEISVDEALVLLGRLAEGRQ